MDGSAGSDVRGTAERSGVRSECLDQVGMCRYSDRQIRQLSGGQQQRVFLARALAQDAQIYFMDEPFAGVDAATEQAIVELLQELREQGKTVLVVHHELQTVKEYFDYVILLEHAAGRGRPRRHHVHAGNAPDHLRRTADDPRRSRRGRAPRGGSAVNELVLTVLVGTAILGGVSGIVGSFAVLRRRALVGDLLSHAALPGICIAFFIADRHELLVPARRRIYQRIHRRGPGDVHHRAGRGRRKTRQSASC